MLPQKQILVVEDNPLNREMLVEILSAEYDVLQAENGREALDILKVHGSSVALILLDVMMPVMDGFTFLDLIKADEELSLIPVIVMTQSDSEDDEVAALSHGAADFVPKPYRPLVILHRVAAIIKLRETAAMINQFQYDRLTGLYSKEFFYQQVRERLDTDTGREYTIVCSDIENFKLYNDTFGRKAGDRALRKGAETMRRLLSGDVLCGRYGADCFLCLMTREMAQSIRENYLSGVYAELPERTENISVKWGIYEITDRSVPVEQMCDRALLAAKSVKGQYNRPFAFYDDALRGKLLREKAITDTMESALAENQFTVYLQPKYSLNNDSLAGAEALVRWIHPEWGFLSPGEFIPLFEKNGFISRLDQYIWERVCAILQRWKQAGYPELPVSVNVSRADIYQADLADTLLAIVKKYDVSPSSLHLEITESAYTENPAQIISTVETLRQQGFIIEMDDFGSGYSSLNMLNQMKLDVLKLDMKFIQSETAKPADQGILHFIVGLARWMNLSVVAEGVETRHQLDRLREIGCDYVQGYFFAKPMPEEEFESLLRTQKPDDGKRAAEAAHRSLWNWTVLLVDEDDSYRKRVRDTFGDHYRILEAADAEQAMTCLRENNPEKVSAVILSASLPGEGAAALLKKMRRDANLWRTPVLATIPQYDDMEAMIAALDTDDFLCKQHPLSDLRRRIDRLLSMAAYQEREQALQDAAFRDYLTGLLNRRGFYAAMESLRQEDLPLAVYIFDLDDLKKVNDRYGHEKGDEMLCFFSELLRKKTRNGDILCRYGGDEFVVALRRVPSREMVLKKGEEICREFQAYQLPDGSYAACSGGAVLCGTEERPSAKLVERADAALYQAKGERKGCCCLLKGQEESAS